jgi:hypothetical protein
LLSLSLSLSPSSRTVHAPLNNLSYFARLLDTRSWRATQVRNSGLLGES